MSHVEREEDGVKNRTPETENPPESSGQGRDSGVYVKMRYYNPTPSKGKPKDEIVLIDPRAGERKMVAKHQEHITWELHQYAVNRGWLMSKYLSLPDNEWGPVGA